MTLDARGALNRSCRDEETLAGPKKKLSKVFGQLVADAECCTVPDETDSILKEPL